MWTCGLLKQNARQALGGRYWRCLLACFVAALLGGNSALTITTSMHQSGLETISELTQPSVWTGNPPDLSDYPSEYVMTALWIIAAVVIVGVLIGTCHRIRLPCFCGQPGPDRY